MASVAAGVALSHVVLQAPMIHPYATFTACALRVNRLCRETTLWLAKRSLLQPRMSDELDIETEQLEHCTTLVILVILSWSLFEVSLKAELVSRCCQKQAPHNPGVLELKSRATKKRAGMGDVLNTCKGSIPIPTPARSMSPAMR